MIKRLCLYAAIFIVSLFLFCGPKKQRRLLLEGQINSFVGQAEIFKLKSSRWKKLKASFIVQFGDSIKTAAESQVEIGFGGNNTVKIGENSKIAVSVITDSTDLNTIEIFTAFGTVLSNVQKLTARYKHYRVSTPTAVATIRGTFFSVSFDIHARITHVNVISGNIWVINPRVSKKHFVVVKPGYFTAIALGKVPLLPKKINYGQWKKMKHLMHPSLFKKHTKKLKIKKIKKPKDFKKIKKRIGKKLPHKIKAPKALKANKLKSAKQLKNLKGQKKEKKAIKKKKGKFKGGKRK